MKEQIIFYERAEKHKSKERTILSFKRALFPGNDQTVSVKMYIISALLEDHRCSKYADYLFEFKL